MQTGNTARFIKQPNTIYQRQFRYEISSIVDPKSELFCLKSKNSREELMFIWFKMNLDRHTSIQSEMYHLFVDVKIMKIIEYTL